MLFYIKLYYIKKNIRLYIIMNFFNKKLKPNLVDQNIINEYINKNPIKIIYEIKEPSESYKILQKILKCTLTFLYNYLIIILIILIITLYLWKRYLWYQEIKKKKELEDKEEIDKYFNNLYKKNKKLNFNNNKETNLESNKESNIINIDSEIKNYDTNKEITIIEKQEKQEKNVRFTQNINYNLLDEEDENENYNNFLASNEKSKYTTYY